MTPAKPSSFCRKIGRDRRRVTGSRVESAVRVGYPPVDGLTVASAGQGHLSTRAATGGLEWRTRLKTAPAGTAAKPTRAKVVIATSTTRRAHPACRRVSMTEPYPNHLSRAENHRARRKRFCTGLFCTGLCLAGELSGNDH